MWHFRCTCRPPSRSPPHRSPRRRRGRYRCPRRFGPNGHSRRNQSERRSRLRPGRCSCICAVPGFADRCLSPSRRVPPLRLSQFPPSQATSTSGKPRPRTCFPYARVASRPGRAAARSAARERSRAHATSHFFWAFFDRPSDSRAGITAVGDSEVRPRFEANLNSLHLLRCNLRRRACT